MSLADELARRLGIEPGFVDAAGVYRPLAPAVRDRLLAVMGWAGDARKALATLDEAERERLLAPAVLVRGKASVLLSVPYDATVLDWRLTTEVGERARGRRRVAALPVLERGDHGRRRIRLDLGRRLPYGYHRLAVTVRGAEGQRRTGEAVLIAPPRKAWQPPRLSRGGRLWGIALQLYGLRSERNWGMGDLVDLEGAVGLAATLGADVVGINPLHAKFADHPERASPYSPSSRLHLDPLYIAVDAMPEFRACAAARAMVEAPDFQERLGALRGAPLVDHAGVAACKYPVLETIFRWFRGRHLGSGRAAAKTARGAAFRAFQRAGGEALRAFALHQAAREAGAPLPSTPEAAGRLARRLGSRVLFHQFLQWVAERQLARAAALARRRGLVLGLYRDTAVGTDRAGAEVWANADVFVLGASAGAPPDAWNARGQDWGLPPFHPIRLGDHGYAPFVALLRANMRDAGAVRLDHAMSLQRLYWIPLGEPPGKGGYVRYPFDELLAVLTLESRRNRCLVVAEDLGTVPAGFSERLNDAGVLSYRLLYFERADDGTFHPPAAYPSEALVAVSTHDLATLAGFWAGHDVALKRALGIFSDAQAAAAAKEREGAKARLTEALVRERLLPPQASGTAAYDSDLVVAVHRFLARTPAKVVMAQIEDMLGVVEEANVPGTVDEHPNWRRKLPVPLERLAAHPGVRAVAEGLRAERGGRA